MSRTFTCLHCGETFPCNPRIKRGQKFCGSKECQRASRRAWKRKNYATKRSYRKKCLDSQKAWRKNRLQGEYQKEYRKKHPEYVARCYEKQKEHYKKRREAEREALEQNNVNRNTLLSKPRGGGIYKLIPVEGAKHNVNRNTLMVRMQILSE